ncbi:hypothetical protein [Candidatus Chloroploca asiatica]|uniref:Uncharacterized protein n=1 Tax=Candidatus Chloroploca asiatica TaxID=1506545 RepID=A0A2H3L3U6_9CHLR|nr:hypothetical protein [Candidatus Chloroploca asiatica]PDW01419.1 hypothetical protein A9Q02_20975 [Candidatus Chloroploca asiatica]
MQTITLEIALTEAQIAAVRKVAEKMAPGRRIEAELEYMLFCAVEDLLKQEQDPKLTTPDATTELPWLIS